MLHFKKKRAIWFVTLFWPQKKQPSSSIKLEIVLAVIEAAYI